MFNFLDVNLVVIKDPKQFPSFITKTFLPGRIKEIRFYKPGYSGLISIIFKNGKTGFMKYYGRPAKNTARKVKTEIQVEEGSLIKGIKLLDSANERRKYPSQASYEYNKFIQGFNKSQRGENVKKKLSRGSKGEPVVQLQKILNTYSKAFGIQVLKNDGIFGPKTYNAVKWFQFFSGCKIDGVVGIETWTAIDKNERT